MKYLNKFNEAVWTKFRRAPDNFIRLENYYLDPINGLIHRMNPSNKLFYNDDEKIEIEKYWSWGLSLPIELSTNDIEIIKSYYKSIETIVKDDIDWDLIQSIKDLSLDYLDKDCKVQIIVDVKMYKVYTESFSHIEKWNKYEKYFEKDIEQIKNLNKPNNFYYKIRILKPSQSGYIFNRELGIDFVEKLRLDHFPELAANISYSFN